jgi:hypothetical protein
VRARGRSGGRRCYACTCGLVVDQHPAIVSLDAARPHAVLTGLFVCGGLGAYVTGWKLNGLRALSGLSDSLTLAVLAGVYGKVALAGVYMAGVPRCETESLGPRVAYCVVGKVADMGERVLAS